MFLLVTFYLILLLGSWCGENSISTGNKEGILQVGIEAAS